MYFVYALLSEKDSNFYIGQTSNIERRILEHNNGKTRSTRNRIPFKVIYVKEFAKRLDARKHEKYLKSGFGRKFLTAKFKEQ